MLRRLQDEPHLSDETRRLLKNYELGQGLISIIELPGYTAFLTILKSEVESDEKKVLGYRDSDPNELFRLHAELQGKRKLISALESRVKSLIALVQDPPPSIKQYVTY